MNGQLVGEVPALGYLDRVDLTDEVRDRDVRRRELLAVSLVAVHPCHLDLVAAGGHQVAAALADRCVGVVVDLAARDDGHLLVEQADERAHDPALGLAALPEKDHVMAGDDGVGQLRQDGLVVADDAGQQRFS